MGMTLADSCEQHAVYHASMADRFSPPAFIKPLSCQDLQTQEDFSMMFASGSLGVRMKQGSGSSTIVKLAEPEATHKISTTLEEIKNTFSLTQEQLADCLFVTRKTVYNWLDGTSSPQHTNLNRLYELKLLCKDWKYRQLSISKQELNEPVINSKSVIELLKAEKLDRDKILFAGSRLGLKYIAKPLADPFA